MKKGLQWITLNSWMSYGRGWALFFCLAVSGVHCYPEQGVWNVNTYEEDIYIGVHKSLYKESDIYIKVLCQGKSPVNVTISWILRQTPCYKEYQTLDDDAKSTALQQYFTNPKRVLENYGYKNVAYVQFESPPYQLCPANIDLPRYIPPKEATEQVVSSSITKTNSESQAGSNEKESKKRSKRENAPEEPNNEPVKSEINAQHAKEKEVKKSETKKSSDQNSPMDVTYPAYTVDKDGVYLLIVHVVPVVASQNVNATIQIRMKGKHGYLSAVDWPLFPFYITMCVVYVIFGIVWLTVSFCQWRDLLSIQFWIGGVIFLGMLEKAVFCAEYESINFTGQSVKGAVYCAEIVSCAKRTLARMLVIIVSLGFGIVKPRLGPLLHRVVGVGFLYFILASVEAVLRVTHPANGPNNQVLLAGIPLSVLDSLICWWIFTSIVQTTRNLRLRRNIVKLSLYRHFTNTLIFAVLASVAFMLWSIKYIQLDDCLIDWKEFWVDQAYWHILFSVILLVIMILWRPTNNNQRYAFTPLLDNPEDEDEEQCVNDAFEGMKLRGKSQNSTSPNSHSRNSSSNLEDDLKWIEEHIPSSIADSSLPILDSDEEIMTTKFEMSKMQ